MASTSSFLTASEKNDVLIERFCSDVGLSREEAYEMLKASDWNFEVAKNRYFNCDSFENDADQVRDPVTLTHDDAVRPPIPPSRDVLVEDDFASYTLRNGNRRRQMVINGSQDFQELSENWNSINRVKRRRLERRFPPPFDLMYRETFVLACVSGQLSNRWLMVNIQNLEEIACQLLNRVWNNPAVKSLIKRHFVFWQVHCDSLEGRRYTKFYNRVEFPYVAVIHPRTGEKLVVWHDIEESTINDLVGTFLEKHSSPNCSSSAVVENEQGSAAALKESDLMESSDEDDSESEFETDYSDNESEVETFFSDSESSEVETFFSDSESSEVETFFSDSSVEETDLSCDDSTDVESSGSGDNVNSEAAENWKDYLGSADDIETNLALRLPDGNTVQLAWPCTTQIKGLLLYAKDVLGYGYDQYELITNFPMRNLGHLDVLQTLKDLDLFPRAVIMIHPVMES